MRKILLIVFIIGSLNVFAGDLGGLKLRTPIKWVYGSDDELVLDGENINQSFAVSGIKAYWTVRYFNTGDIVFTEEKEIDDVEPGEDFEINFGKIKWSNFEVGLKYSADVEFTADFDEDESNNKFEWEFTVESNEKTREEITDIVNEFIEDNVNITNSTIAYLSEAPIPQGTIISWLLGVDSDINLESNAYLAVVIPVGDDFFAKTVTTLIINPSTGEFEEYRDFSPPVLNDVPFGYVFNQENTLIYGTPTEDEGEPVEYISNETTTTNDSLKTCVLLVNGRPLEEQDSIIFRNSAAVVKNEFKTEARGPSLPEECFTEMIDPSAEDLYGKLDELKEDCDKIVFYYIGHADTNSRFIFSDTDFNVLPIDILDYLQDAKASELCFIIDACYSGVFINDAKRQIEPDESGNSVIDMSGKKISIITSSDADSPSKARKTERTEGGKTFRSGIGAFTNSWATSFGSEAADANGDGTTTTEEAFDDARSRNPRISNLSETNLNDQNPQKYNFESASTEQAGNISFDNNNFFVYVDEGLDNGQALYVKSGWYVDIDGGTDENILDINNYNYYDIELLNHDDSEFKVNLDFRYDDRAGFDNVDPKDLGVIYRIDAGFDANWMIYEDSEVLENEPIIRANNVIHFSRWTTAVIKQETSVRELSKLGIDISTYPNPFAESLNIELNSKINNIELTLTSPLGRHLRDIDLLGNSVQLNLADLSNGLYYINVLVDGNKFILPVVKSE
jgi:hypothetical protein